MANTLLKHTKKRHLTRRQQQAIKASVNLLLIAAVLFALTIPTLQHVIVATLIAAGIAVVGLTWYNHNLNFAWRPWNQASFYKDTPNKDKHIKKVLRKILITLFSLLIISLAYWVLHHRDIALISSVTLVILSIAILVAIFTEYAFKPPSSKKQQPEKDKPHAMPHETEANILAKLDHDTKKTTTKKTTVESTAAETTKYHDVFTKKTKQRDDDDEGGGGRKFSQYLRPPIKR